ncbi:MAG: biotin--[acetyl-CoA-carboxylase] ligase [Armatimonadota bacterium]|nr:biotin--[acetyl-CoA-carboxylase] ligase [Armatimonadota bacterium]
MDADVVGGALTTRWLGRRLIVKEETGSTNDDAALLASAGEPAGTVVIANWQQAGRGRRGRRWVAPPGTGLLLSVVLRPRLPAAAVARVAMAGALATAEALRRACGLRAVVKYPNDVLLSGRKVAGVLLEARLNGKQVAWAVLGVGVNVRHGAVDPQLAGRATSIEEHAAAPNRNHLAAELLNALEDCLERAENHPGALVAEWCALDQVLNQPVTVTVGGARLAGVAAGVDVDGRLLLALPNGTEHWLSPEEVTFRQ